MAREQQRLIRDNYQAEMLMKNAQLKALEQQINPTFSIIHWNPSTGWLNPSMKPKYQRLWSHWATCFMLRWTAVPV